MWVLYFVHLFMLSTNMNHHLLCQPPCPVAELAPFTISVNSRRFCILIYVSLLYCCCRCRLKKSQVNKHNFQGSHHYSFFYNDIIQQVGYHNKYNIASNSTLEARPSLNNIQSKKTY